MKYLLLFALLLLPSCAEPEKPRSVSTQYNQSENRAAVVVWRIKAAEIKARNDFGSIDRTAASLDRASKDLHRAEMLRKSKAIAESEYDIAVDNYVIAKHAYGGQSYNTSRTYA
jgi:multidrug resistance efflux pump